VSTEKPVAPAPQYPIESVGNALRLLLMFRTKPYVRLYEACDELDVARSTAHRLMSMLVYYGFVRQDEMSKAYVAGSALVDVGLAVVRSWDIRATAHDLLERLRDELHETANLCQLDGRSVRFLDSVESHYALRVASRTGVQLPAYSTSMGKALLAELDIGDLHALFPDEQLGELPTEKTIATRTKLEAELAKIRRRGYATNTGESEGGLCAVGVAVVHPTRGPVAGLSVSAPVSRMSPVQIKTAATLLTECATELATRLL
jgi:IclR family transcriptional regulator, acetate operon repressor